MGAFKIMLVMFFIALIVLVALYLGNMFLNILPLPVGAPSTLYNPLNALFSFFGSFFDNSFLFIFMILIVLDLAASYLSPSKWAGIGNIILLFSLAFISLFLQIGVLTAQSFLSFNVLLPQTYTFISNGYYLTLTFFALIVSTIFNFRSD